MLSRGLWQNVFNDSEITEEYFKLCADSTELSESEIHHILPKSIFPECKKCDWNLVRLSYSNHYKVHALLPKMCVYDNHQRKMTQAWWLMSHKPKTKEFLKIEEYSYLRELQAKANTGKFSPCYGRKLTPEQCTEISERQKGSKSHSYGKKASAETRAKLSLVTKGEKNGNFGRTHTAEVKEKIRLLKLGNSQHEKFSYAQYSLGGVLIKEFVNSKAIHDSEFKYRNVNAVCNGYAKTHKGFIWKKVPKIT